MDNIGPFMKALRYFVFLAGDTRRVRRFPWITMDVHQHLVSFEECEEALKILRPGDIILHRDSGFLSNVGIGGCMIHAGIYVGDNQVVEAVSEGVVRRHANYILYSDYSCIVRPALSESKRVVASKNALEIVGLPYDFLFQFNDPFKTKIDLLSGKREGIRFCCTEIPYYCYMDHIKQLNFYRKRQVTIGSKALNLIGFGVGENIVTADMYIYPANTKLIWKSKSFTSDWVDSMRVGEGYKGRLQDAIENA